MYPVEVNDVSISYMTGDFKDIGVKEFVVRKLTGNYEVQKFWADKHISFKLEKGDMLGIVGTNGAGKSTLLKAITGIMVPTEGTVKTRGKIAALLELASGFDGDLTVKENAYLRGALLGYTREFMDEKYEEIIEFAELEEFQDRMFKQLSSGMKSRLGFSIACLVNPDIIILDEVLSVGDGAFRKKSRDRMKEILNNGVTGMLVSHSVSQVRELCNKVIWLDHGRQIAFGDARVLCDAYEVFLAKPKKKRIPPESMEAIQEDSRRYNLYIKMSQQERVENHTDEAIMDESVMDRQKRWMRKINAMTDEERANLYKQYSVDYSQEDDQDNN